MNSRIIAGCLLFVLVPQIWAAKLLSVTVKEQAGSPSVLFNLDKPVPHKIFILTDPNRVVIDFEDTQLAVDLSRVNRGGQLINTIRSGYPNPHTLRLVFEVSQKVRTKTTSQNNSSFSLNLSTDRKHAVAAPIPLHVPPKSLRDVVIVLDPGHGGKDPGAIGPKKTLEKNITLAIARQLKKIIDKQPGMHAVLTRQSDYYIELRDRLKIARRYNADVFISIHADAFINRQSNGASVFALSQSGATSEAARWLAEKENYSELGGVNLSQLDDQSGLVRTVLIDLSQTATIGASLHMGEQVLNRLESITSLHNNKVEQARFMVLKSPDIPSILIETGFISNPREEKNLNSPAYQVQLTQAIFAGLNRYFWDNPPQGTRIEALAKKPTIHLVKNGDSLSKIAAQYRVSPSAISLENRLAGNPVQVGQKLLIPVA